jgi:2-oxoglutarate ferredoxin oxidoreductase subunit gamma
MTKVLPDDLVLDVMLSKVPPKVHEANKLAYSLGKKYAQEALA